MPALGYEGVSGEGRVRGPFFSPSGPKDVFINVSHCRRCSPRRPQGTLAFVRGKSTSDLFHGFLVSGVGRTRYYPCVPSARLLQFSLTGVERIPPMSARAPFRRCVDGRLLPCFRRRYVPPTGHVSLHSTICACGCGGRPSNNVLGGCLVRRPTCLRFQLRRRRGEALCQYRPQCAFPLGIIRGSFKCLVFSNGRVNEGKFERYVQCVASRCFSPRCSANRLTICSDAFVSGGLIPLVSTTCGPYGPVRLSCSFSFCPTSCVNLSRLPGRFVSDLGPMYCRSVRTATKSFVGFTAS